MSILNPDFAGEKGVKRQWAQALCISRHSGFKPETSGFHRCRFKPGMTVKTTSC